MSRRLLPQWKSATLGALLLAAMSLGTTGCTSGIGWQIWEGGQTLPSGYYLDDDIQYFAPGPEFKLSREAAAQKAYRAEQMQRARTRPASGF
jgi:hypothetical protein